MSDNIIMEEFKGDFIRPPEWNIETSNVQFRVHHNIPLVYCYYRTLDICVSQI